MKIAAFLFVVSAVYAAPEFGKYDVPQDVAAQQLNYESDAASLPLIPLPNAAVPVLMYFPEYNAILVPAESISPDYLPSSRRKKPIGVLVKLIKERMAEVQQLEENTLASAERNAPISPEDNSIPHSGENDASGSVESDTSNSTETEANNSTELPSNTEPETSTKEKPTHLPLNKPDDFLASKGVKDTSNRVQANTFGQLAQVFQRPNTPFIPDGVSPDEGVNFVQNQQNRPSLASFLPSGITNYIANPPKRPISTFLETRFPFIAPIVAPRSPYIHYYTKTPTSEAFYYNSLHPSVSTAVYSDVVHSDITDYINRVQESLLQEQMEVPTTTVSSESAMMVASVPMGHNQATSLLLRPVAKAVAGANGVAVASPVAKAVLRKGEKVDIDYDPDAVAIAGPGGQAHAHPKLIISYEDDEKDSKKPAEPSKATRTST